MRRVRIYVKMIIFCFIPCVNARDLLPRMLNLATWGFNHIVFNILKDSIKVKIDVYNIQNRSCPSSSSWQAATIEYLPVLVGEEYYNINLTGLKKP